MNTREAPPQEGLEDNQNLPYFEKFGSFSNSPKFSPKFFKIYHFFTPFFKFMSITFLLTIMQIIIYFATEIYISLPTTQFEQKEKIASYLFLSKSNFYKHFFVLLTYMFQHASPMHLIANMTYQIALGFAIERHHGTKKFILTYLFSGIFGGLFHISVFSSPVIGASGAIFGLYGFNFAEYIIMWHKIDQPLHFLFRTMLSFMIISLVGSFIPYIATLVHLQGFITGALMLMLYNLSNTSTVSWFRFATLITGCIFLGIALFSIFLVIT